MKDNSGVEAMKYEDGFSVFENLKKEISGYGSGLSEADTRCKIIDKILTKCLGWEEENIRREEHVNKGYIDYIMRNEGKGIIVEAKKVGTSFELPAGIDYSSRLTISKLLKKERSLEEHYNQVLKYCLNAGIQFGCFTNGLSWVLFPALRTDGIKLHMSKVIVFRGIDEIENNFLNFWNLLSKVSITDETINKILLPESKQIPPSYIVNDREKREQVHNRNILSDILSPVLPEYFGDLIGPESLSKLEKCYVEPVPLSKSTGDRRRLSKTVGEDPHIRQFVSHEGVYADLNRTISTFLDRRGRSGILYILLGRIGSGKSTFLYHYFYIENKSLHDNNLVYYLNWLEYDEQQSISDFFYEKIDTISKQTELYLENSDYIILEKAFQEDIISLKKGPLGDIENSEIIKTKISELLMELSNKKQLYYSKFFNYLRKKDISTILIFDNIDQLKPELQEDIIKFAFSIYEKWGSFTLVSLREENYVKSKREGSLSTIQCTRIHLPKPSIIPIIERRLECFANDVAQDVFNISTYLSDVRLTTLDLKEYIDLISRSIVSHQDKVKKFLEVLALGNIRDSLEFFRSFLSAGNTDSGKIIDLMKKSGYYLVPDHEFIKSISLESKRFFSEINSPIINLYSISDMETPSHFTKFRILKTLSMIQYQSRPYGAGYENINRIIDLLKTIGISEMDVQNSIISLTKMGLIENDLHTQKYLEMANAIRITPAGEYYLDYLSYQFAYIDLMQQDTPIFDKDTYDILNAHAYSIKMDDRFRRCRTFVDYLINQEKNELSTIEKITDNDLLTQSFMQNINERLEKNISKIQTKLSRYDIEENKP